MSAGICRAKENNAHIGLGGELVVFERLYGHPFDGQAAATGRVNVMTEEATEAEVADLRRIL